LIYKAVQSLLAQPKNVMVGHFLSAIIGVSTRSVTPLSVSMSIVTMQFTKKVHLLVMQQHLLPLQVPQKLKL